MSMKIAQLMAQPEDSRDPVKWLGDALQAAVELELSTLPPYLCGLWCLQDQKSDAAKLIRGVVFDEMSHFGLACNMLRAVGPQPQIVSGYDQIVYPGHLPGGVRPKCDSAFFPCDEDFKVVLGFDDFRGFAKMAMQIEYPEDPVPRPKLLAEEETYPTIGQFYDAVLKGFEALDPGFKYQTKLQIPNGFPEVFVIDGLPNAQKAIHRIQTEGEGGPRYPYTVKGGNILSHFYKFGEIYFGKLYVYDAAKQTGDWSGTALTLPAVYPMTPVPLGGYGAGAPPGVADCDRAFTAMLNQLDQAWATGSSDALGDAVRSMDELKAAAMQLLKERHSRPGGGIYGPQFRKQPKTSA